MSDFPYRTLKRRRIDRGDDGMGELSAAPVQLSDVCIHELTREEEAERKRGLQVNLEFAWRELGVG
ncbi:hypothetical protein EMCG_04894 [[Emmonsia] crescens]|uniref:Uncharacterized protein n=1 Tax=[Emmonsia] crescens TaxID=73230 RepID=A0A0G2IY93_9EURO|nr:hypothetical protein EMCG_04894 [Emmonsia crescens UAMH 3008]